MKQSENFPAMHHYVGNFANWHFSFFHKAHRYRNLYIYKGRNAHLRACAHLRTDASAHAAKAYIDSRVDYAGVLAGMLAGVCVGLEFMRNTNSTSYLHLHTTACLLRDASD